MLSEMYVIVHDVGLDISKINIFNGVKRRGIISPIFFSLYMDPPFF